ncbi:MAG: hypothetical protein HY000_24295 [Planctomycetes bacterium]|nr:hypothetical protein [Planctomycetota bacterium]
MAVIFGVFLCSWLVALAFAVYLLTRVGIFGGWPTLFLIAWLTAWAAGGYFLVRVFYSLVGRRRPENVTLDWDLLRHDLGYYQYFCANYSPEPWKVPRWSPVREIPKAEVSPVRLEDLGGRLRLTIDHGAERIEIGRFLQDGDRRSLARRLQEWVGRS